MGSVYRKGNNVYCKWREDGKQRYHNAGHIKPSLTKKEAQARERKLRKEAQAHLDLAEAKKRGLPLAIDLKPDPKGPKLPPLGPAILKWYEARVAAKRKDGNPLYPGAGTALSKVRCHVEPILGHIPIDRITRADVKRMVEGILKGHHGRKPVGASSAQQAIHALGAYLGSLQDSGDLIINPARKLGKETHAPLNKMKPNPKLTPFYTKDEQDRIFWALPEHIAPAYFMGCQAGLRKGEALALRWSDLDFKRMEIRINGQRGAVGADGQRTIKPVKDGEGRLQPMTPELARVMKEWKLRLGGGFRFCFPQRVDRAWCDFDREGVAAQLGPDQIRDALRKVKGSGLRAGSIATAAKLLGVGPKALARRIDVLEGKVKEPKPTKAQKLTQAQIDSALKLGSQGKAARALGVKITALQRRIAALKRSPALSRAQRLTSAAIKDAMRRSEVGRFRGDRRAAAALLGVSHHALNKRIAQLEGRGDGWEDERKATAVYRDEMMGGPTLSKHLDRACASAGVRRLCWKDATRHTYGSNFVGDGGHIVELRDIMGHCSVKVTERYAHNNPDHFSDTARAAGGVKLSRPKVIALKRKRGEG